MDYSLFLLIILINIFNSVQPLTISGYGIRDLENNDPITFQKEADLWGLTEGLSSAKITQTTNTQKWLLGGPGIMGKPGSIPTGTAFERAYKDLPPHSFVTISVVLWYFDTFGGLPYTPALTINVDGTPIDAPYLNPSTDFTMEDGGDPEIKDLTQDFLRFGMPHSRSILTLSFINLGVISNKQAFGFRELNIHLSNYSASVWWEYPFKCHISKDMSSLMWDPCACPIGKAKATNGNCMSCAKNCDFCFARASEGCLVCSDGTYWDGAKCNTCHLMCQNCTGMTSNDCSVCKYGFYNYGNNTCMVSCEYPFVAEQRGAEMFCNKMCDSSQFYWAENKTCLEKCDFPLISESGENGIQICLDPCANKNNFLYSNGSCYTTCQAPLLLRESSGAKFCENPCSAEEYLYPNRSCLLSCPYPLLSRSEPGVKYCYNPCASLSDYIYPKGTCENNCKIPLVTHIEPDFNYCKTPCNNEDEYVYSDGTCRSECEYPYKIVKNVGYKICSIDIDEIQTHSLASLIDLTNKACGVGGFLTGFVIPGDPNSMLMWSLLKMLQSPRFMNVNFPHHLKKVFAKQRVLIEIENLGDKNFLENYGQQMMVFGALGIILTLTKVLEYQHVKHAKYLASALQWNIMLMFFCGTYGDLIFSSTLAEFGLTIGSLTCLIMTTFAVYIPLKILYVINTLRCGKNLQNNWSHNRVFFETFQSEHHIQHIFLFIYLVRIALFNLIIGLLFKYPLAQALLINFLSFGMMIYLLSKTPLKDKICFAQHVLMEVSLFVYNLCLLILVIAQDENIKAFFGDVIVFIMILTSFGTAALIMLKLTLRIKELYQQKNKAQSDSLKLIKSGIEGNQNEVNSETLSIAESYQNKGFELPGYGIKDLEGNDPVTFQKEADLWNLTASVSSAKITQTTSTKKWLLGGHNILGHPGQPTTGMSFSRTYNDLPPHSFVGISIVFWYFDSQWGREGVPLVEVWLNSDYPLPNQIVLQKDFSTFEGGIAGEHDLGRVHAKYGHIHHEASLTLNIKSKVASSSDLQSFGFREIHLHFSYHNDHFPNSCQISEDVSHLSRGQCPCPINQAWDDAKRTCVNCAAHCDLCFGPKADECLACSPGAFWDGIKCNTCALPCDTCTGTTQNECSTCRYGFYNYGNNTCLESCEPPFKAEKKGAHGFCRKICDSSQFYWAANETCQDKCDFPLIQKFDENGIKTCVNPCSDLRSHLYPNGSCLNTCQPPLLSRSSPGVKYCVNPCSSEEYLYPNRSCMPTCPSPLLSRSESGCQKKISDKTIFSSVDSLVSQYSKTGPYFCCKEPSFCSNCNFDDINIDLFCPQRVDNGSCEATCPAPLISRSEPGLKYCGTPCPSVNDFIYDNRSCGNSCSSPLMSRTEPFVARYCSNPCPLSEFLYPNGSCLRECSWPLLNRTEPGVKYCSNPCPDPSDYIYPNGTCENKCPFPLLARVEPDFSYCSNPCKSDQYLYSDQSCYESCDFSLIKRFEPGVKYCETPCKKATHFIHSDGTCSLKCEYPYKVLSNPSYKICVMNTDEIQINQAQSLTRATDIANTICGIGGLMTGFFSPGDPTSMLMWSLLKMLQFTKFMDVNFPTQMTVIFTQQNNISNVAGRGRILTEHNELGKFSYYHIPHGFLENYKQQLIVYGLLLILIIASALLLCFLRNPQHVKTMRRLKSELQWNVILMFFCGSYGDLILYSAIEFQTASFNSVGSVLGFIFCLVMVILGLFISLKILYVIWTLRKAPVEGQKDAEKKYQDNRVFFETYKSDDAIQHIFLFIYLVRVAFFNIIIGFIFKSPLAQALLINLLNLVMLSYLVLKSPIKDKFCFAQHVNLEFLLFVYHSCLLILVIMDIAGAEAEMTRAFFGGIMIFTMIMAPVGTAVLIVLKLILKLREIYFKYIERKSIEKAIRRKEARAHGNFVIENNGRNNSEMQNLTDFYLNKGAMTETEEFQLVPMPQNQNGKREEVESYEISISSERNGEENSINLSVEVLQIYPKKVNLKRRKFSVFKNDDYLPD